MKEEWKVIPNHPDYEVSNLGNFRRKTEGQGTRPGKPRKTYINPVTGYRNVTFGTGKKGQRGTRTYSAHRLVAEVWVPNPDKYCCVDHINKDRADNRVENLRWLSYKMNTPSKPCQAIHVKDGEGLVFRSALDMAAYFGVTSATISSRLKKGEPWRGYRLSYLSDKKQ